VKKCPYCKSNTKSLIPFSEYKQKVPTVGSKIYVGSSASLFHGCTDVAGGLATVARVKAGISDGKPTHYVEVKEHPGHSYNWKYLAKKQSELRKRFMGQKAKEDPDLRPEFNKWL
jgi:hypothetical protein